MQAGCFSSRRNDRQGEALQLFNAEFGIRNAELMVALLCNALYNFEL